MLQNMEESRDEFCDARGCFCNLARCKYTRQGLLHRHKGDNVEIYPG